MNAYSHNQALLSIESRRITAVLARSNESSGTRRTLHEEGLKFVEHAAN
jgi:hypothetical protein